MNNQVRVKKVVEFSVSAIAIILANLLSYLFLNWAGKIMPYSIDTWRQYALILAISYIFIFVLFSRPLNLKTRDRMLEFTGAVRNCLLTYALFSVLLIFTKNEIIESRYLFLSSAILFIVLSLAGRYVAKRLLLNAAQGTRFATVTGIITVSALADDFVTSIKKDWSKNVTAVALLDAEEEDCVFRCPVAEEENGGTYVAAKTAMRKITNVQGVPVVANWENLIGWVLTTTLDEVYIHVPDGYEPENISMLIEELEDMGITVNFSLPSLREIVSESKFDNLDCEVKDGYPVAVFSPTVYNGNLLLVKQAFDFVGGLIGSLAALVLIALVAIPLKKESPGPLIFKQPRVGKNGRIFNIYKIRSMYVDAEERKAELLENNSMDGHMFKMEDDPRITKVGRFIRKYSIDEFPQFWNVLKGDMSVIGTRPPTLDEFEQYEKHHKRRLSLKPGITGIWQVSGRSDIQDFEEVVKLDCEYIDNWSIWLDIKILFKTVGVVLTHKGAK